MTESDILYRVWRELKEKLSKDGGISKIISASAKAPKGARLTVTHNVCKIDNEWLENIELGLVYIGRAIEEDRQFIRSEGEVLPIENVKRVSKESIRHLSRHSDFISKRPKESEDLIPDKLYTVQRDSDYAVYENRFLYLLLCNIRDFVRVRYDAINSAYKEYRGEYAAEKRVVTATRRIDLDIKLVDEQDDVLSAPADKQCADDMERMDKILQSVAFYLRTPLMSEVAHSEKLSGAITKTNVLLMDKNFNEALKLYEYLLSYDGDGYTITRADEVYDPVPAEYMEEFSVPPVMLAFIMYKQGLGLEEYLSGEFKKAEEKLKEEQERERLRKLALLKKKIENSGKGAEEYMLALEESIKDMSRYPGLLDEERAQNEELSACIMRLEEDRKALLGDIEKLNGEIDGLHEQMRQAEEKHRRELEDMRSEYERQSAELKRKHEEEMAEQKRQAEEKEAELRREHGEEIARMREERARETAALKKAHAEQMKALEEQKKRDAEALKAKLNAQISDREAKLKESRDSGARMGEELNKIAEELRLTKSEREVLQARLTAIRKEHGLLTEADDFTTEEGFNALEHEFEVLGKLVREQWTDVKKILKKEFYANIHETMHAKKAKKSKEYSDLRDKVLAQREEESGAPSEKIDGAQPDTIQQESAPEQDALDFRTDTEAQPEENGQAGTEVQAEEKGQTADISADGRDNGPEI